MARARATDHSADGDGLGGTLFPPSNPLRIVQAAVAGDDLSGVLRSVAEACGGVVIAALPSLGAPIQHPRNGVSPELVASVGVYAEALVAGEPVSVPDGLSHAVPARLGPDVVGVVAMIPGPRPAGRAGAELAGDAGPWLEAAATAAAVLALMREGASPENRLSGLTLLEGLAAAPPAEPGVTVADASRLGVDLTDGAIGICALMGADLKLPATPDGVLLEDIGRGVVLGLVPLNLEAADLLAAELVARLNDAGAVAAASSPRREPGLLHEALVEAAILAELANDPLSFQEETYRLLVGVMLRSPEELSELRTRTVAELERYDALHDTELLGTLEAFLAHHGSTTETAEAMKLHRHTVGYRLARVQEVSGLSPYESDGRERLSLGLKADRILAAERRRSERSRRGG